MTQKTCDIRGRRQRSPNNLHVPAALIWRIFNGPGPLQLSFVTGTKRCCGIHCGSKAIKMEIIFMAWKVFAKKHYSRIEWVQLYHNQDYPGVVLVVLQSAGGRMLKQIRKSGILMQYSDIDMK
jgi:hypothetical protein